MLPLLLFAAGIAQLGVGWYNLPWQLPENYSFFEKYYRKCMREPVNQGKVCNSCVPYAIANHLTHRICQEMINKKLEPYLAGKREGRVSYQMLLSCMTAAGVQYGCNWGDLGKTSFAWMFRPENKLLLNECVPYTKETWEEGRSQSEKCPAFKMRQGRSAACAKWVHVDSGNTLVIAPHEVDFIKRAIIDDGPVAAYISLNEDTNKFRGPGIYEPQYSPFKHALVLVGWGVENGVSYWIAENSWGDIYEPFDEIHNRGFFRIKMTDEYMNIAYATSWSTNLY